LPGSVLVSNSWAELQKFQRQFRISFSSRIYSQLTGLKIAFTSLTLEAFFYGDRIKIRSFRGVLRGRSVHSRWLNRGDFVNGSFSG
jgi:hypothetical protein